MLKKILLGAGLTLLIGLLVAGAVVRTLDKTGNAAAARGLGRGAGRGAEATSLLDQLSDGQTIVPQDEINQPEWLGGGQRGYGGLGRIDAPGDGTGTGQAQVDEWLTLQGTVLSVDADSLVVQADSGEQVIVENRAWWFAQEQGFTSREGDRVTVVGFYENDDFEVGQIDDLTTGQMVSIRDASGRPLWAGRGRRGA
jgi:hypothetical protein